MREDERGRKRMREDGRGWERMGEDGRGRERMGEDGGGYLLKMSMAQLLSVVCFVS